jgi:hypothetical protein
VTSLPDQLALERHRDLDGRRSKVATRALLALLAAVILLGLANAFGQRPQTDVATASAASLKLYAPKRLRSGLYFEARFRIRARKEIRNATLVLDPGWLEGMTLNTLEPAPIGETSRDGKLALELGHIPAGRSHLFFLQFQVNPTNVGRRSQQVELHDGTRRLLSIERTVTVFP